MALVQALATERYASTGELAKAAHTAPDTTLVDLYRRAGAEAGHPPETLRVGLHCFGFLGDDVEQATSAFYPGWAAMFTQVSRERGFPPPTRRQFDATRVGVTASRMRLSPISC